MYNSHLAYPLGRPGDRDKYTTLNNVAQFCLDISPQVLHDKAKHVVSLLDRLGDRLLQHHIEADLPAMNRSLFTVIRCISVMVFKPRWQLRLFGTTIKTALWCSPVRTFVIGILASPRGLTFVPFHIN